jgi:hypothetical protein
VRTIIDRAKLELREVCDERPLGLALCGGSGSNSVDERNACQFHRTLFVSSNPDQDRSRPLFAIQQRLEIRERRMGRTAASGSVSAATASRFQLPLVFIVVAVQA